MPAFFACEIIMNYAFLYMIKIVKKKFRVQEHSQILSRENGEFNPLL